MKDLVHRASMFASYAHRQQFRKGSAAEPYMCHVEEVAGLVSRVGGDDIAIAAAFLHDVVEDCEVPESLIGALFGADVAMVVSEVTDDKALPKSRRKELQIINAAKSSERACLIKVADKTSNVLSIAISPPEDWDYGRQTGYIRWATQVVEALKSVPVELLHHFCHATEQAEIAIAERFLCRRQAQNVALDVMERRAERLGASPEQISRFLHRFLVHSME